jgi:hypothetical protein
VRQVPVQLQRSGRYLQSYLRFQSHVNLFLSDSRTSVFAKLTPQQRIDARNIVNDAQKKWRETARTWKKQYFLVPGFVKYDQFTPEQKSKINECFETYSGGSTSEQIKNAESKHIASIVGQRTWKGSDAYKNEVKSAFTAFEKLPDFADAAASKAARSQMPDAMVWWYVKLNPALFDNPQYSFEILDDVKFKDQEQRKIPAELLSLGSLFNYTQEEIQYDSLGPAYFDMVEQFHANARRVASRVSMVCSKAHRAYIVNGKLVADTKSDHSAHSSAAGMKLLLHLAHYGGKDEAGSSVNAVEDFTSGIVEVYSQMKANGVALEDTAVPSNVETKAVFDSVYATTPEDDSSAAPSDSLTTEQWIARLEDAFDKNVP